ncbi:hypothetical protein PTTG_06767, partial [Puccinia triticina 1-1 BBBD Race 1]
WCSAESCGSSWMKRQKISGGIKSSLTPYLHPIMSRQAPSNPKLLSHSGKNENDSSSTCGSAK